MDQTWVFKYVIGIIVLALSFINNTETTEYYCTRKGYWYTAMSECLDHGGTPVSYLDLVNGTKAKVKEGTTAWTADYLYLEYVVGSSNINDISDCGYTRFRESRRRSLTRWKYIYTYTSSGDVNYDICSRKRRFMCEHSSATFEGWWFATWPEAYGSCKYPFKLWKGYTSIEKDNWSAVYSYSGFWVDSVRRLEQNTVSRPIPSYSHFINCGTSEGTVKRERYNSCNHHRQAVCKFEYEITDTRFSRSCLQVSSTPETSRQPTEKSTESSNSKSTTASSKLSTQSTVATTELSNSKTTAASSKLSTQSTETFTEIISSKKKFTITEPYTQPTVISTELVNNSGFQSTSDRLSITTIIVIVTATIAVIIGRIVTVLLVLYFCKKRRRRKKANSGAVQFKRNSPSTARVFLSNKHNATNIARDDNEAEVHDYDKACVHANVQSNMDSVNCDETENGEYHYVLRVRENPKPPYTTRTRRSTSESEYDTTNSAIVFHKSSNIYNKLGYKTPEDIYDSTMSKPNGKPALDTNIYSKTSKRENLYDTTAIAGVGVSRPHDAAVSLDDNIYSQPRANENGDSKSYGNIVRLPKIVRDEC